MSDKRDPALEQAQSHLEKVATSNASRDINNTGASITSPPPTRDIAIDGAASRQRARLDIKLNDEYSQKNQKFFGFTVGNPRELSEIEMAQLGNFNISKEASVKYKKVKFSADGTPSDAFPAPGTYVNGSRKSQIANAILPEILIPPNLTEIYGSISSGTRIIFSYLDKRNNLNPLLDSIPDQTKSTFEVSKNYEYTAEDLKEIYKRGTIPEKDYFKKANKRKLNTIKYFIIHDTAGTSFTSDMKIIGDLGLGIHWFIAENGRIIKTAEMDKILGHAGHRPWNLHSLGVEIVNPVGPFDEENNLMDDLEFHKDSKFYHAVWANTSGWGWKTRKEKKDFIYIPTHKQMESTFTLVRMTTSSKKMNIPMKFLGLTSPGNEKLFIISGKNYWTLINDHDDNNGGIAAHSYRHHADGAVCTLYCYLRSIGKNIKDARELLLFLLQEENLIVKDATFNDPKRGPRGIKEYYANLKLVEAWERDKKFKNFNPVQSGYIEKI